MERGKVAAIITGGLKGRGVKVTFLAEYKCHGDRERVYEHTTMQ